MLERTVLNAFRHHWNLHSIPPTRSNPVTRVLNAFRHHWNLHVGRIRCLVLYSSAQRLSASLESSPKVKVGTELLPVLCSTPFGIIGIFTAQRLSDAQVRQ